MSDTWSDIQEHKRRQESLRERLQKRRRDRQGINVGEGDGTATPPPTSPQPAEEANTTTKKQAEVAKFDPFLENHLIECLCDSTFILPVDSFHILNHLLTKVKTDIPPTREAVESLLQKFAIQDFISIKKGTVKDGKGTCVIVIDKDHSKLDAVAQELTKDSDEKSSSRKRKRESESSETSAKAPESNKTNKTESEDDLQALLSMPTMKEQETKKVGTDILDLLNVPSHKEQSTLEKFKSQGGAFVHEFCESGTRVDCQKNKPGERCKKVHFRKILQKHTDESLGDCSFLNTCFHMDTCKYVHYEVDYNDMEMKKKEEMEKENNKVETTLSKKEQSKIILYPPQYIQCDVRTLDTTVLGKFSVIMADPPWDIHMELPYGTMSDDEMRQLNIPALQDNGYIFLWVTGRAMELGRECLELWGYERCDELIWVKTNQLQRLIRTGRTGHWLNHGKEHCLVGVKGDVSDFNRGMDCDVLVAEVRETSHKPDEIYGVIERLSPGTRKLEIFGRQHNIQPNWVTLGNQLDGVHLLEPDVVTLFKKRYPDGNPLLSKTKSS